MYLFNYTNEEIRHAAALVRAIEIGYRGFGNYTVIVSNPDLCGEIIVFRRGTEIGIYVTALEACLVMMVGQRAPTASSV